MHVFVSVSVFGCVVCLDTRSSECLGVEVFVCVGVVVVRIVGDHCIDIGLDVGVGVDVDVGVDVCVKLNDYSNFLYSCQCL